MREDLSKPRSTSEEAITYWLRMIDERFIQENLPIPDRVLRAAQLVVEHAILEFTGDTKDGYWDKPWFKSVYQMTKRWYQQHYGTMVSR